MMNEEKYLVLLYSFIQFGPARTKLLVRFFGSAKSAWNAKESQLTKTGLSKKIVKSFLEYKNTLDEENYFTKLSENHVEYITQEDGKYPRNLLDIDDPPLVLYVRGKLEENDETSVAIVGSRKMSTYGREIAESFSSYLSGLGITIVSGLARGIDTHAHKGALLAEGKTIAVLGRGLDKIYPSENTRLAEKIVDNGGCLISEYPLGYPALRSNFASRNRIISGMSRAVIVVEGEKKSGTLLTASHAANQGREVFAIPGQITSPLSAAPHYLINNGARLTISPEDVLAELDLQLKVNKNKLERVLPKSKNEKIILETLERESLHIDEIARISTLKVSDLSARLTVMEIKGLVKNLGQGIYKKL